MEEVLRIRGGVPLRGSVEVRGSKNTASKLMIASVLSAEPSTIENVPLSQETEITRELCEHVGSVVSLNGRTVTMETKAIKNTHVDQLSRKNRVPILAVGPLLHRAGSAEIPVLGGCPIGHRPVNFHWDALAKMGVKIERREQSYFAEADEIRGTDIEFPFPSVGATENVLLTAVLAKGTTTLKNAAIEPEIMNMIAMLKEMGAAIAVDEEKRLIMVTGVSRLSGAKIRTMPDRPEIISFAVAALATDGDVFVRDIERSYLASFLEKVAAIGGVVTEEADGLRFSGKRPYRPTIVETGPHPKFMTDWQQPFSVLLTQAEGLSIIHETVYEDRFGYTKDLRRMGAEIEVVDECLGGNACRFATGSFHHSARITGPTKLHGEAITMTDIRAGMAHVVAALAAEGESVISGISHLDRGYEKLDERLKALGADVTRVQL